MFSFSIWDLARLSFLRELARFTGESSRVVTSFVLGSIPRAVLAATLSFSVKTYSLVLGCTVIYSLGFMLLGLIGLPDKLGSLFSSYFLVDSCKLFRSSLRFYTSYILVFGATRLEDPTSGSLFTSSFPNKMEPFCCLTLIWSAIILSVGLLVPSLILFKKAEPALSSPNTNLSVKPS